MVQRMATAEEMAAHDKDAWQALDMVDIERAQHTGGTPIPDDGISFVPLANRRIWCCGHYFTFFDMQMNARTPLSDSELATISCASCTVQRVVHLMVEESEDSLAADYTQC